MESIVGKNIGKYRIVEHLGSGGMAEVYKAHQPSLDRYVAIKLMHPFLAQDAEFRGRFEREAKAVAALRHSNIIQVHDFDIEGGQYYMVMEFIDGPTLRRRIEEIYGQGRRLPIPEVIRIIKDVGSALAYAHKRGMVHRDVKPANVMMDSSERVVLTDFGIAKILSGPQYTASGAMVGTPAYMAPEIGLGKPGDGRSDIYALGVMLYQLLTGRVPYDADTPVAVMMKHINEPLPMPRSINPEIPEGLERIILKAMAKNPADRYQTVDEMVRHLSNLEAAARIQYPSGTTVMDGMAYMAATVADMPPAQATVADAAAMRAPATVVAGQAVGGPAAVTAVAPPEERKRRFPCLVVGIVLAVAAALAVAGGGIALGASGRLGGLASLFAAPTPAPTATATPVPSPTPVLSPTPDVNATNNAILQMTNAALVTALAPTATPDAAATAAACVYAYTLEKTDPSADTVLGVNKPFTLTLNLHNSGNCAWPKGTLLTLKEGDQLDAKPVIDVPSVEAGQTGKIEVAMQAPASAGSATQTWELRLPDGRLMGSPIALSYRIGTAAAGGTPATGARSVDGTFTSSAASVNAGQSVTLSWDLEANQDFIFSAEIWEFATGATQPRKHSIATAVKEHAGSQTFSPSTTTTYELNIFYNDKDEKAVVQKKSVTVTVGGAAGGTTGGATGGPTGGPVQINRVYSTGRSERIANTNDGYFIISIEFTGGAGPYTLTGDGMQDFGGSQTFNANLSSDRTFFWIEFRMRGGCGALNPATVRITDANGQTAAQSYVAGGNCP